MLARPLLAIFFLYPSSPPSPPQPPPPHPIPLMQRHEEPKAGGQPGDDWEQGTYVYFDHLIHDDSGGSGWCYRLKQDFLFQYDALEAELV
jgi:hypothetical protein